MKVCPDDFYPRAYDLGEKQDVEDFIEDFKTSKAISLLINCRELKGINVNKSEVTTALNIIKRKLNLLLGTTDLENKFNKVQRTFSRTYNKNEQFDIEKITDKEWEIISNENMDFYREQIENISKQGLYPKENKKIVQPLMTKNKNVTNKNPKAKSKTNLGMNKIVDKKEYIQSEEDKKLEEEIKADFKNQEKERQVEKEKLDKLIQEKEEERIRQEKELELKKQLEEEKRKIKIKKSL